MSSIVALFGLKNAGKKTLSAGFKDKVLPAPTETFTHVFKEQNLNIHIIDLDPDLPSNDWVTFLNEMEVRLFIYALDGSNESQFDISRQEFLKVLAVIKNKPFPLLVLINKIDLTINSDLTVRVIQDFRLLELADRKWLVHKVSSKTGEGIKEALHWIYESFSCDRPSNTLVIKDLLIFSATGELIAKAGQGTDIKDPYIHSSLLAALEIVSQASLDGKMDALTLGDKKIVFGRKKDQIGALVTSRTSDTDFAIEIINRALDKIENVSEEEIQDILAVYLKEFLTVEEDQAEGK